MNYLIIGAGGTGGALAGYLGKAGRDVTVIARGAHLAAIQNQKGLLIQRPGDSFLAPVRAVEEENYHGTPDVVFVCVKGYSLESIVPLLARVSGPDTVVIPILNLYGTGEKLQKRLPDVFVTDGCIYVASQKKEPGVILMSGLILRVVFGVRPGQEKRPKLSAIQADLETCGITGILSDDIRRDCLLKFSYVSPQGACGLYYGIPAGPMQKPSIYRDTFSALIREIGALASAMGISFQEDLVARNLKILDDLDADMTTSLQKDVAAGRPSEIDGLIFWVVQKARELGILLPWYEKIAQELEARAGGRT
ncbi:MAG: ketopantoate reductase family protein [Lachnospiraceae bacterium]